MGSCTARGFELRELKALPTPARQASSGGEILRCHHASTARWQEGSGAAGAAVFNLLVGRHPGGSAGEGRKARHGASDARRGGLSPRPGGKKPSESSS